MSGIYDSPKLLRLSYSSENTFNSCPRKWLLSRLKTMEREVTIDTAFGKAFGDGCQALLEGKTIYEAIWAAFLSFDGDFEELDVYTKRKSIWTVIDGLKRFELIWNAVYADRYELVYYNGKPACELGFRINFPDGSSYIGFLDAVLLDKETRELVVLEAKTTGSNQVHEATFGNSAQGTGYGIVLDSIAQQMKNEGFDVNGSSYQVLYFIYKTKVQEFQPMPLNKSLSIRANWLRERAMKISVINFYKSEEFFPKDGSSCINYSRPCTFYGICDMSIESLVTQEELNTPTPDPRDEIQFTFTFDELVERQRQLSME